VPKMAHPLHSVDLYPVLMKLIMIVLAETADNVAPATSRQALAASAAIAQLLGFTVYPIVAAAGCTDTALSHIPPQPPDTPGIWLGYPPPRDRYDAIYTEALTKGIRLLNTPAEHQHAQEFDQAYPQLVGLTPESIVIGRLADCEAAIAHLGLPLFVRGAVESGKPNGWNACVATTAEQVQQLVAPLLTRAESGLPGRVLLRQLVKLRHSRVAANGFPLGREFRVFIYRQRILSYGYYWHGDDPGKFLSVPEEEVMSAIALEAAWRIQVPYVAVDVGQLIDGSWIVIETGDPQFSSVTQVPLIHFWHELGEQLRSRAIKQSG